MRMQRGISLVEVLAAIFVVSVGLLGVLAVIPFGAFQVSQAHHAGYASNMLVNAVQEIEIREMAKPMNWGINDISSGDPQILVFEKRNDSTADSILNCTKLIWVEPQKLTDPAQHIFCVGTTFTPEAQWIEIMRGQDALVFLPSEDKRPKLAFQKGNTNGKTLSSGKYTWFFTFLPKTDEMVKTQVPLEKVKAAEVDVLACLNRLPEDDRQVIPNTFAPSFQGGSFILPNNADHWELLKQTKYVFVTWGTPNVEGGEWCKIVLLDKKGKRIVVTGELPSAAIADDMRITIPSGVLYHKRVSGVEIQ